MNNFVHKLSFMVCMAFSSGLTDVEIMFYNHSHGGGVFKSPAKPQVIFWEMS